jgi:hypothetical protein
MVAAPARGEDAVMRLLALLFVLTAIFATRAGVALADDPPGVAATELVFADEVEFPADTVMFIATGCWFCDGPTSAIYRVSRAGQGPVHVDLVFRPGDNRTQMIIDVAYSEDGGSIFATRCDAGHCAVIGTPTYTEEATLFRSDDGGITWATLSHINGMPAAAGVTATDVVYRDWLDTTGSYRFGDGRVLTSVEAKALVGPRNSGRWSWDKAGRTITFDGGLPVDVPAQEYDPGVFWHDPKPPLVLWYPQNGGVPRPYYAGYYMTAIQSDGRLKGIHSRGSLHPSGWFSNEVIAGTFEQAHPPAGRAHMRPSLLDFEAGIAYPIADVFDKPPFGGRNWVELVLRGPFLRVATPECLPLRAWADAFASVTACAAPGVLLRPTGGVRYEHGVEWRETSMPNGTSGWVQRASVEG